jgi:hypothetical protein
MSKSKGVHWGRWAGAIAGVVLLIKSLVFVIARLLRLTKNEVQARGSDTAYVLGLAERRRAGRG